MRRHIPNIGPTNSAVTVVLFIKAETAPVTDITYNINRFGFTLDRVASLLPTLSSTPVSRKAPLMTNIEARITIKSLLNPANASAGVSILASIRIISRISVTISTDNFSVAKTMIAINSNPKTKAISIGNI
jgi:hypothetical protein